MRRLSNLIEPALIAVCATCLCVGCGDEQKAADDLKTLGFQVVNNSSKQPSVLIMQGEADKMQKAVPLLPQLSHLGAINALSSGITDEVLAAVGKVSSLTSLNLSGTSVTDVGVGHLTGLSKISDINLSETKITSACLPDVGKMTSLVILNLSNNDIAGGFESLSSCKKLEWLVLGGLKISDADAEALAEMPNLKRISLSGGQIGDSAAKMLKGKGIDVDLGEQVAGLDGEATTQPASTE